MTRRRIAIMIDGGFFLKKLPALTKRNAQEFSAQQIALLMKSVCRQHVMRLTGCERKNWQHHTYRIFYYDARPYDGKAHHPTKNINVDFSKSEEAQFRNSLFNELRKSRKVALRLGKVRKDSDWSPPSEKVKRILSSKNFFENLEINENDEGARIDFNRQQIEQIVFLKRRWLEINDDDIRLGLKQKGVDMRIGIDISSISLKKQADTMVLIAGDSDFVPAAKLARREGVEFILDSMRQSINDDLFEHIDGLYSAFNWSDEDLKRLLEKGDFE